MPLYGPCSWNILVHRCFEASDSGSRNRDFIVLFTQKTWLCSKSESEVTGAFGDTHKVKTGVRLGKMSFRWGKVLIPEFIYRRRIIATKEYVAKPLNPIIKLGISITHLVERKAAPLVCMARYSSAVRPREKCCIAISVRP